MTAFEPDRLQWPMSYNMRKTPAASLRKWWRLSYYRGPQNQVVHVSYCKNIADSEIEARRFVNEPVLGFDMEWPMDADKRPRLQDKIALIQIATEDRIALFHISLHTGTTPEDLIAPTLKKIIESPSIIKTGVAIMNADFSRLQKHFKLNPKGACELSHLYNLIMTPEEATTRLRALSMQVQKHLGLPLWKGSVRTSDWSLPLTPDQVQYAAGDAYAGFMLFHCMNAKRLAMKPIPPFPRRCEEYLPFAMCGIVSIHLESVTAEGEIRIVTAEDFYSTARREGHNIEPAPAVLAEVAPLTTGKPVQTTEKPVRNQTLPTEKPIRKQNPKRRRVLELGRSIPSLLPADKPTVVLHTGLSFIFEEVDLTDGVPVPPRDNKEPDVYNDENLPLELKRKREASRLKAEQQPDQQNTAPKQWVPERPSAIQGEPVSTLHSKTKTSTASGSSSTSGAAAAATGTLDRERMLLRKKLDAYIKSVVWAMPTKPTKPLATDKTLNCLVMRLPRTFGEFQSTPNIQRLLQACRYAKKDIWQIFEKWTTGPEFDRLRAEA